MTVTKADMRGNWLSLHKFSSGSVPACNQTERPSADLVTFYRLNAINHGDVVSYVKKVNT